jgi:hypothetical protein
MEEVLDFIRNLNAPPIEGGERMSPVKKTELSTAVEKAKTEPSTAGAEKALLCFTAEQMWM